MLPYSLYQIRSYTYIQSPILFISYNKRKKSFSFPPVPRLNQLMPGKTKTRHTATLAALAPAQRVITV